MEHIASRSPEPPVCGAQALADVNKWFCMLTVPAGCKEAYQAADPWREFFFIEEGEAVQKYVTVSIEANKGGKVLVNGSETPEKIKIGSDVELQFVPEEEHYLGQAVVNGEDITAQVVDSRYTVKNVADELNVKVTFKVNRYRLTYMLDGMIYMEAMYEYGAVIIPEPQPEGDYTYFEWVGVPETMPAHDVVVTAVYETGIAEIMALVAQGQARIYSPDGKPLGRPRKGVNIVVMKDGTVKKVLVK